MVRLGERGCELEAAPDVKDVEDTWFFLHSLFEQVWNHRFLYRDLNNLLSGNRHLEKHFHEVLERKTHALRMMLESLASQGLMVIDPDSVETLSASMAVMVTYWLSYEYVRDPRRAMEPESAGLALSRGARHVLALLSPYLSNAELRTHLTALTAAYSDPATA